MAWLTATDAAHHLKISDRTLRRRLAGGQYPVRREGRQVLVDLDVPGDADRLADIGDHLSTVATQTAITHARDLDILADIRADYRDNLRSARRSALGMSMLVLTAIGIIAWGGYRWHLSDLDHAQAVAVLKADAVALEAENRRLSDLGVQRDAEARSVQQALALQAQRMDAVVSGRDRTRRERDRALAMLRITRIVEAVVGMFSTGAVTNPAEEASFLAAPAIIDPMFVEADVGPVPGITPDP